MRVLIFLSLLVIAASSCNPQKQLTASKETAVQTDSTEYEIHIIDPEFDKWYLMNFSPGLDRSNEYYRSMNQLGVSNWNNYFTRGKYSMAIGSYINYSHGNDYGLEVNRRLYWYFKYVEDVYRIRLLR